jgi:hypothetical protein
LQSSRHHVHYANPPTSNQAAAPAIAGAAVPHQSNCDRL